MLYSYVDLYVTQEAKYPPILLSEYIVHPHTILNYSDFYKLACIPLRLVRNNYKDQRVIHLERSHNVIDSLRCFWLRILYVFYQHEDIFLSVLDRLFMSDTDVKVDLCSERVRFSIDNLFWR